MKSCLLKECLLTLCESLKKKKTRGGKKLNINYLTWKSQNEKERCCLFLKSLLLLKQSYLAKQGAGSLSEGSRAGNVTTTQLNNNHMKR